MLIMTEAEEYARLIGKIGGNKGYLTTICNGLDQYLDADELDDVSSRGRGYSRIWIF